MVCSVTEGVRVAVESFYLSGQSTPELGRYAFAYRITISNESEATVQLLRRNWIVTDADARVTEVSGDGVVGEQPVLEPGASHTYTSGSVIQTDTGTMQGSYEMREEGGRVFEVEIPVFLLSAPRTLH